MKLFSGLSRISLDKLGTVELFWDHMKRDTAEAETLDIATVTPTNDEGDALLAAQRILHASYTYCLFAGEGEVPAEIRRIVHNAKERIGQQFACYLKGERRFMSGKLVIDGENGNWVSFDKGDK